MHESPQRQKAQLPNFKRAAAGSDSLQKVPLARVHRADAKGDAQAWSGWQGDDDLARVISFLYRVVLVALSSEVPTYLSGKSSICNKKTYTALT